MEFASESTNVYLNPDLHFLPDSPSFALTILKIV